MNGNNKEKDYDDFEKILKDYFGNEEVFEDEPFSFTESFKEELLERIKKNTSENKTEQPAQAPATPTAAEIYWKEEYGKLLAEQKKDKEKIKKLEDENREHRQDLKDMDVMGATNAFLGCLLGLLLPIVAIGLSHLRNISFTPDGFNIVLLIVLVAALIFAIVANLLVLGGAMTFLINGLSLDRAYRERKFWKIFLAVCVFLVFMILFIMRGPSYS